MLGNKIHFYNLNETNPGTTFPIDRIVFAYVTACFSLNWLTISILLEKNDLKYMLIMMPAASEVNT